MSKKRKATTVPGNPFPTLLCRELDASRVLSVPVSRLRYWRVRGGGPRWVQLGKSVRYRLADLDAFVKANLHEDGTLHVADLMKDAEVSK